MMTTLEGFEDDLKGLRRAMLRTFAETNRRRKLQIKTEHDAAMATEEARFQSVIEAFVRDWATDPEAYFASFFAQKRTAAAIAGGSSLDIPKTAALRATGLANKRSAPATSSSPQVQVHGGEGVQQPNGKRLRFTVGQSVHHTSAHQSRDFVLPPSAAQKIGLQFCDVVLTELRSEEHERINSVFQNRGTAEASAMEGRWVHYENNGMTGFREASRKLDLGTSSPQLRAIHCWF